MRASHEDDLSRRLALRQRAFDYASEGLFEHTVKARLMSEFPTLAPLWIKQAVQYAFHGESGPLEKEQKRSKLRNKQRARKMQTILCKHYDRYDMQTSMADLIADLLHLADAGILHTPVDFDAALDSGRMHYNAELYDSGELAHV